MRLQDKVTIFTGAADGIGLACAKRFCAEGAKVVLSDINDAKGEAEATELKESDHHAEFAYCDVSEKSDVEKLVDAALTHRGRLDCLVANAGIVHVAGFLELEEKDFDRVLRTNLKGIFLCARWPPGKWSNKVLSRTPMGRLGEPDEAAKVALFLASDDSSYVTGKVVYTDGGRIGLNYTVPVAE